MGSTLVAVRRAVDRLPSTIRRPGTDVWWGLAAAATTLFLVRLLAAGWPTRYPPPFPDSASYFKVATLGPLRPSFWFGERPVLTPLLYWALGRNVQLIVLAQSLIYVAAFWWAGRVLWLIGSSAVARGVGTALLVGVAVQPRFALWNLHVLSESLSISLGVAMAATWVWFAARPDRRRLHAAFAITALWALTRDSNLLIAVVFVLPAVGVAAWRSLAIDRATMRTVRRWVVAFVVIAVYVVSAQASSGRNRYPTLNVIGQRVLFDSDLTDFYVDAGMPLDDALLGRRGRNSWDDGEAFLRSPELAELRSWARARGQTVQLTSSVLQAHIWVPEVWRDLPAQLAYTSGDYDTFGVYGRLPDDIPVIDGPRSRVELYVWGALAALGIVALVTSRRHRGIGIALAVALVATAADVYVSWVGDSVEVQRHLVGAIGRLGVLLALTYALGVERLTEPGLPAGIGTAGRTSGARVDPHLSTDDTPTDVARW
jgi:hypothetical protein